MGNMTDHWTVSRTPEGKWEATAPAHHDALHTHSDALPLTITRDTAKDAIKVADFLAGVDAS